MTYNDIKYSGDGTDIASCHALLYKCFSHFMLSNVDKFSIGTTLSRISGFQGSTVLATAAAVGGVTGRRNCGGNTQTTCDHNWCRPGSIPPRRDTSRLAMSAWQIRCRPADTLDDLVGQSQSTMVSRCTWRIQAKQRRTGNLCASSQLSNTKALQFY